MGIATALEPAPPPLHRIHHQCQGRHRHQHQKNDLNVARVAELPHSMPSVPVRRRQQSAHCHAHCVPPVPAPNSSRSIGQSPHRPGELPARPIPLISLLFWKSGRPNLAQLGAARVRYLADAKVNWALEWKPRLNAIGAGFAAFFTKRSHFWSKKRCFFGVCVY